MAEEAAFGFNPEDFDRIVHDAGEGLREAFDWLGQLLTAPDRRWTSVLEGLARKAGTKPATAGEAGDGVWAIYTVGSDGDAHVEQVYPTELEALRANRHNTDPNRKVRFLPYGIAVAVLDDVDDVDDVDDAP